MRRRERGFSLVELLVVIAILAILSLVGMPWFMKISQRNQVRSAGQELAVTLAAARMRAVKRNVPARVVITTTGLPEPYTIVETYEQTQPTPLKVGEFRFGPAISFPATPLLENQTSPMTFIFQPDGRVNNTRYITIRGVTNAAITNDLPIEIARTGKVEVLKPNPTSAKLRGTEWH